MGNSYYVFKFHSATRGPQYTFSIYDYSLCWSKKLCSDFQRQGKHAILMSTDQCRSKFWNWSKIPLNKDQWWSMPIKSFQYSSIKINETIWLALIGIDLFWSALESTAQFLSALIVIDWHWALIGGVLECTLTNEHARIPYISFCNGSRMTSALHCYSTQTCRVPLNLV